MITKPALLVEDKMSVDTADVYTKLEIPDVIGMKHVVFLDLDNFGNFFDIMPYNLPADTFIWIFRGSKNQWKPLEK